MAPLISPKDHIERLRRDGEEVGDRVRALTDGLNQRQISWRPEEGSWSIAECLDHLTITNGLYMNQAEAVLKGTIRLNPQETPAFRPGPISRIFIRSLQPGKGRYKVPKAFRPSPSDVGSETVDKFFGVHTRAQLVIDEMEGIDLTRTKVQSPLTRWITFRIGDMMDLLFVHSKRHVLQAERVMTHPEFPDP